MLEKNLYQHGTMGALMAGLLDGTETISKILEHGSLGIGTLHGLDGELIILDGVAYQGRSDGALIQLSGTETASYAAVTNFMADKQYDIEAMDGETLKKEILSNEAGENLFLAVKVTGLFKHMHIRIMPKQEKPYKRLVEVSKVQPEFQQENIQGTLMGFFTPVLFQGIAVAGFHLHFVDEAKTFGGHVMDFEVEKGHVEISQIESLIQHFPVKDPTFVEAKIDYADLENEIQAAE